jgi:hypothetical protein
MIQMIHWFTKNQTYENAETMSMLDTFMVIDLELFEVHVLFNVCTIYLEWHDFRTKCVHTRL